MLPSSCVQQAVPPITYCRMAVQEFFSNLNSSSKNEEREILILNKVEIVLNMVKVRTIVYYKFIVKGKSTFPIFNIFSSKK